MRRGRRRVAESEAGALRERVERLEADLAFLRSKHEALLAEGDQPRRENAVLRYDLQKCQRDRQVLDWHLNATRSELRMALALVRGHDGAADPRGRRWLERAALLAHQARAAGVDGELVAALEAAARRGWGAAFADRSFPAAEDAVALGAAHLAAELEARRPDTDAIEAGGDAGWQAELRVAVRSVWAAVDSGSGREG